MIRDVVPNSPADNAGLKAGDEIVKVDEISVVGVPHDKVRTHTHVYVQYIRTYMFVHTYTHEHANILHAYCTYTFVLYCVHTRTYVRMYNIRMCMYIVHT